jgi:predicted RNase H-like nuclease (RuvC/YqgF family)
MTNEDYLFFRSLPDEIVEKMGEITEPKLAKLKETQAIVHAIAAVFKPEIEKRDQRIAQLETELEQCRLRIGQLEAVIMKDLQPR